MNLKLLYLDVLPQESIKFNLHYYFTAIGKLENHVPLDLLPLSIKG